MVGSIWRHGDRLLVCTAKGMFALVDPTGAIVTRYESHDGFSLQHYYVEDNELRRYLEIATVDIDEPVSVVLSPLVPDDDPATVQFVAVVLGDAAVTAEESRR